MILRPVLLSRLPVGSSASRYLGWFIRARAMATRWRSPPESSFGRCLRRSARPTRWRTSLARRCFCRRHDSQPASEASTFAGSMVFSSTFSSGSRW